MPNVFTNISLGKYIITTNKKPYLGGYFYTRIDKFVTTCRIDSTVVKDGGRQMMVLDTAKR